MSVGIESVEEAGPLRRQRVKTSEWQLRAFNVLARADARALAVDPYIVYRRDPARGANASSSVRGASVHVARGAAIVASA